MVPDTPVPNATGMVPPRAATDAALFKVLSDAPDGCTPVLTITMPDEVWPFSSRPLTR